MTTDPAPEQQPFVPPDGQLLTPYICPREAAAAIAWYAEIFGAVETIDRFVDPDGRVGHAGLSIGGAHLMVSDAYPDFGAAAPVDGNVTATFALNLYVPDVDDTVRRAAAAGAVVQRPPEDESHGSRQATLVDPFGVRWMLATHLRTISTEEMGAAATSFGETGSESGPVTT